jgi:hypothetical protein
MRNHFRLALPAVVPAENSISLSILHLGILLVGLDFFSNEKVSFTP